MFVYKCCSIFNGFTKTVTYVYNDHIYNSMTITDYDRYTLPYINMEITKYG